ncbi:hypothetical protein HUJ05_005972 [Dendroctonus ponderosae]|nr:hypothetical protein HUJ05_005972 [Dendroctonus ponderosae]
MTTDKEPQSENDPSMRIGTILARPPPGEELVISGMSGFFPLSANNDEFEYNLENKIEMVSHGPKLHPELPLGLGSLKDRTRFDSGFFGIPPNHVRCKNPIIRMLLEKCYESILDAGLHPSDLAGTRTGVFIGAGFTESELHWYHSEQVPGGNVILGNQKSQQANKLSYLLRLQGPSFTVDTACSSSATAVDVAYRAIRTGQCDAALVGGTNLLLTDGLTLQFSRLGVLSMEGRCRPFDADGTGYVRSETIGMLLIQKARDAHRIYATVVHAKSNCDGYKEEGITYPSGGDQKQLFKEMYLESGIAPSAVSFIEAHGTGTPVGDPEEMNAIDQTFTAGRTSPLLIGSVKSSVGHAEVASCLCSIAKVILGFEKNKILPNINYVRPRPSLQGIFAGRIKVVVENTAFPQQNNIVGLNSFGFGGANVHMILKQGEKVRVGRRQPLDALPRLGCVSGRTEAAVHCLLDDVAQRFDEEHIALVHNVFRKPINNHIWRGYVIVSQAGVTQKSTKERITAKTKLRVLFGGIWRTPAIALGTLLDLPALSHFKSRLLNLSRQKHLDLTAIGADVLRNALIQMAYAELLKVLQIDIDRVRGHSLGKFCSAYYDNSLTLEEYLECMCVIANEMDACGMSKESNSLKTADLTSASKSKLQSEFARILEARQHVNGFGSHQVQLKSAKYFAAALSEPLSGRRPSNPKNWVTLEIGQSTSTDDSNDRVLDLYGQDDLLGVLDVIGRLFEWGQNPQIQLLYPRVQFPVSRGTPGISSKIKWKHDKQQVLITFGCALKLKNASQIPINIQNVEWMGLDGHVVDGRNLFPATGYLFTAWLLLSNYHALEVNQTKVIFENCKFLRACTINKSGELKLEITMQTHSGKFEITESNVPVATGYCRMDKSDSTESNQPLLGADWCGPLKTKDIYKELRLRGYGYKGIFRSVVECNNAATAAKIKWTNNWIAFLDNALHLTLLQADTRMLYVPTGIRKLRIDPEIVLQEVQARKQDGLDTVIPITSNPKTGMMQCAGIELAGLSASSIPRKKITALPVLEKYVFVPNHCKLTRNEAIRVFMQIVVEETQTVKVTAVELIDDANQEDSAPLGPLLKATLEDLPLIRADITLLSAQPIETDLEVESKSLAEMTEKTVVVASKLLSRALAIRAANERGYLISREPISAQPPVASLPSIDVISALQTEDETLVLLRRKPSQSRARTFVNVSMQSRPIRWLAELKKAIKTNQDVVLWCQHEPLNGILGKREPDCGQVRGLFIVDSAPEFAPDLPFYQQQLDKDVAMSIYKNGAWGTYRHLLLGDLKPVQKEHCYANSTVRGDLSSIKWIEGPLTRNVEPKAQEKLVEVYYSSLNFRDVMLASGRINVDVLTKDRRKQDCVQGLEYAGKTLSGKKVMGMLAQGTLSTLVEADPCLSWDVPQGWSLREAATVPVVYATCLYALEVVGKLRSCDTVLIHSGTGGIGQAAINLCLAKGCTIFTTVGTREKREYLRKNYPQINGRYCCDPSKSYVICGGLGGFGLELADWLVLRGAQNLVLTSRKGITTGYQQQRTTLWQSYGCNVKISTQDITVPSGCEALLGEANALAPVKAVFNLAVVLQDATLPNQTEQSFEVSFGPKADATRFLDKATRRLCPELSDFVVFSSVSCGRGNGGQTNYGMSNSVMERVCERRRHDGYPAVAIEWGAIGDVGLVAEMFEEQVQLEIGGTLQQSIASCFQVLDRLLRQTEAAVVSSIVVAEKKASTGSSSILDVVAGIIGITDLKSVSLQSTLAELGMDSMNGVEMKQTLEREYGIVFSPAQLRGVTLARILELHQSGNGAELEQSKEFDLKDFLMYLLTESDLRDSSIAKLPSLGAANGCQRLSKLIAFPGIEGQCELLKALTQKLEVDAIGLSYTSGLQADNIPETAARIIPFVRDLLEPNEPFHLVAHSMGCCAALQVASDLEHLGLVGTISFIDGSPAFIKELSAKMSGADWESVVLCSALSLHVNEAQVVEFAQELSKISSSSKRLELYLSKFQYDEKITKSLVLNSTNMVLNLMKACMSYHPTIGKLKSKARLFKPTMVSISFEAEDYELGQYFEQPVEVLVLEGDHRTILNNDELAESIMSSCRAANGFVEE